MHKMPESGSDAPISPALYSETQHNALLWAFVVRQLPGKVHTHNARVLRDLRAALEKEQAYWPDSSEARAAFNALQRAEGRAVRFEGYGPHAGKPLRARIEANEGDVTRAVEVSYTVRGALLVDSIGVDPVKLPRANLGELDLKDAYAEVGLFMRRAIDAVAFDKPTSDAQAPDVRVQSKRKGRRPPYKSAT
ncbi:MAG: hypothetical protein IPG50_03520 [Myxococcales bacterium]|nr:hypothetical protein [Myxococcales bacterium]